ncbi:uncharacterized protein LOC111800911 isoform X2 [Cucurbita pepo subsp. pepo]|uniref:uncharacterized protein LOC111800911 isoform X2 n=1 Tax=Cucurbita pepo subsp. pepo TaxID=3664 RepID=UPI000C9D2CDA|nr:uncharacterized protein LOC111800911 isoform X2 [Cucurbita pepo subsp. pepo]
MFLSFGGLVMSTPPNMATITAALERSLQNCSLSRHRRRHHDHHHQQQQAPNSSSSDLLQPPTTLDLNSHISLPCHWEQCLDLKVIFFGFKCEVFCLFFFWQTGEIYYINWRNGMKAKEDPRSITEDHYSEDYYYSDDDDDDDSDESSTESSNNNNENNKNYAAMEEQEEEEEEEEDVLVVAGCKSCLMYFMVPKLVEDCPKCSNGQLLHFDRSENEIP